MLGERAGDVANRLDAISKSNEIKTGHAIEDDRLRLIFTCCHPAIDPSIQVPLTLREVCKDSNRNPRVERITVETR